MPDPLSLPDGTAGYIITVDVMSERAAAFSKIGYGVHPSGFDADDEAAALGRLPHLIAIQWDDAAHFRALIPDADVLVAPVVVDAGPVPTRTPVPGRCVFVGSGALHNVDGIRWFIDECWPQIRAGRPDAELHVIGTVCTRLGTVPPGVVLRGRVDDLVPEYAAAAAVVVPLRAGSGLKVKLVDALCHGVPTVTTPTGAQGLMAIEPRPFEVAEEPSELAAAVERVLADPSWGQELERRAATIASRFSPDEAFRDLDDDLRSRGVRLPATRTGMDR